MAGVKSLRKIQFGREGTAGTEANATTVWGGNGTITDNLEMVFVEEDIGYLSGRDRSYIPKVEAGLSLEATPATFEQLPHIFEMGIKTATATQDGTGTDYIYAYPFPTTAANTIKTYTVEAGDNQQEEQFLYTFCPSFTLSGNAGEAWMVNADLVGRQVAPGTFTASQSRPAVEEMLFGKSKLYIDDTGGTIGTTQATNTFLSATINVNTGLQAVYTGDGQLYFTFVKSVMPEITLDVTFEHDATSVAEKVNWRAQTAQLVRILVQGSTVATPGTVYSVKTAIFDIAGKWESFEAIGDQDGNDIIVGHLRGRYVLADTQFSTFTVVNELSALP